MVPKVTMDQLLSIARGKLDPEDVDDKRLTYSACSARSYQFEVVDRSMEPTFPIGTAITVDREKMPAPGDCVLVALLAQNIVLFRRYRPSAGSKPTEPPYTLRADNPDYEPISVTAKDKPIFLGTKVEHATLSSR